MADLQNTSAEIVRVFLEKNLTLGTAESLTGGGKTLILDETSPLAQIFYGN